MHRIILSADAEVAFILQLPGYGVRGRLPEDFQAASLESHKLSDAAHQGPLDEFARFNLWTGNTGAHHRGRSCLEGRLRDASHLRDPVVNLLTDLKSTLHDTLSVTRTQGTGTRPDLGQGLGQPLGLANCIFQYEGKWTRGSQVAGPDEAIHIAKGSPTWLNRRTRDPEPP
ncbi:hypothetical protein CHU98_g6235 [Xylaria longipes]|nr:hypothetical protein CHU98_g6235 [Xylaria longipes]